MEKALATLSLIVALGVGAYTFTHQTAPKQETQKEGSISGPIIQYPYLSWGGVLRWSYSSAMALGTSTVCAIQAPAATTTLKSATLRIDTSPLYAIGYGIGYSTTKNATTTALVSTFTVASGATSAIIATSTTSLTDGIVAPNAYINFNISTSSTGSNQATGTCQVTLEQI